MGTGASFESQAGNLSGKRRNGGKKTMRPAACRLVSIVLLFICFAGSIHSQSPETLIYAIQTGTSEQKRDALFHIRNFRSEVASRIAIPALKDPDILVRATAASSVIFLPKAAAVAVLAPLLDDKAEFVRQEAAYALGTVGSGDGSAPLLRLLQKEKIYEVRTAVVSALGSTGDANAVPFLVTILKKKPKEDQDFLRRSAARSVGQIAQLIVSGNQYLATPQNFLPEKYKDIPTQYNNALTMQSSVFTQAAAELSRVLRNKKEAADTRREAAFALGAIGDRSAIAILESNLNNPDYYLAEISREALLKIKRVE